MTEEPWHPDQQLKEFKNGEFELTVRTGHDMDIIPKVLQLGSEAELVSPASARTTVAEIVKELSKKYK